MIKKLYFFILKVRQFSLGRFALTLLLFTNFTVSEFAQNLNVTGTITDENGAGVPRATVQEKGTIIGTATVVNGYYAIVAPIDPILVVSSIGYQATKLLVNSQSVANSTIIREAISLDKTVVTRHGSQKQRNVKGSIVRIKVQTFREVPATNVVAALQGQIAGVDIAHNDFRPGTGETGKPQIIYDAYLGQSTIMDQYPVFNSPEYKKFRDVTRYNTGSCTVEFSLDEKQESLLEPFQISSRMYITSGLFLGLKSIS